MVKFGQRDAAALLVFRQSAVSLAELAETQGKTAQVNLSRQLHRWPATRTMDEDGARAADKSKSWRFQVKCLEATCRNT